MFRNWLVISILVLLGLSASLQHNSWTPPASNPIALDGGGPGDGSGDDDNPGGPGL